MFSGSKKYMEEWFILIKDLGYFERIGCFGPYLECLIYLRKGLYNGRSPSRLLCFSEPGLIVAFFVHLLLTCKGINNSLKKMHMTTKLKHIVFTIIMCAF